MDKHNKHSKNKNKGVNKTQPAAVSGSGLIPTVGSASDVVPAAKTQPKTDASKRK